MKTIQDTPDLKVSNLESLPGGLGCKYLVCFEDHKGRLIAKQWKRKRPAKIGDCEVLVVLKGG